MDPRLESLKLDSCCSSVAKSRDSARVKGLGFGFGLGLRLCVALRCMIAIDKVECLQHEFLPEQAFCNLQVKADPEPLPEALNSKPETLKPKP